MDTVELQLMEQVGVWNFIKSFREVKPDQVILKAIAKVVSKVVDCYDELRFT